MAKSAAIRFSLESTASTEFLNDASAYLTSILYIASVKGVSHGFL